VTFLKGRAKPMTSSFRRENLQFLVDLHGTQTELAQKIPSSGLTQQNISRILVGTKPKGRGRGRRQLDANEARGIEKDLIIPDIWIDNYDLRQAWSVVKTFQGLSQIERGIVNDIIRFVVETPRGK
jgi:hypothetical protein